MKIATMIYGNFPGGPVGHRARMMMKGLVLAGNEVHILCPRRFVPGPLSEMLDGIHVHWGGQPKDHKRSGLLDKIANRMIGFKMVHRQFKVGLDWFIIKNFDIQSVLFSILARIYHCSIIMDFVELPYIPEPNIFRRIAIAIDSICERVIMRSTQLNVVISTYLEKYSGKHYPNIPVHLYPIVVDTNLFSFDEDIAQDFRDRYNLNDEIVISYLGSFLHSEGVDIMLKAFSVLLKKGNKFTAVIAGRKYENKKWLNVPQMIDELRISDSVIYTGYLETADVIAAMSASDILIISKITHYYNTSGLPQKLAEYLSMDKTVISTSVGDIPLYLKDGENGLLCEPDSVDSLVEAIDRLIDDPELRTKLSKNARKTALKNFDCIALGQKLDRELKNRE